MTVLHKLFWSLLLPRPVRVSLASGIVMVCEDFYEYAGPRRMIWGRLSQRIVKT
jgi:hypothetical protein